MIKTFVGKWWITRRLYLFIFSGDKIRKQMGVNSYTHGDLIMRGVRMDDFENSIFFIVNWKRDFFNFLIFKFVQVSKENMETYIDFNWYLSKAQEAGWIEKTHDNKLKIKGDGSSVYVWYYPLLRTITVTFANTNIKSIVIAGVILWFLDLIQDNLIN